MIKKETASHTFSSHHLKVFDLMLIIVCANDHQSISSSSCLNKTQASSWILTTMSSPSSSSSSSSSHSRHGRHPGQVLIIIHSKEFGGSFWNPTLGWMQPLIPTRGPPYCLDHSHKNWTLYILKIGNTWNMWHIASWTWGTQLFLFLHLQFLKIPWTYQLEDTMNIPTSLQSKSIISIYAGHWHGGQHSNIFKLLWSLFLETHIKKIEDVVFLHFWRQMYSKTKNPLLLEYLIIPNS